jgi:hypothetical protein
VLSGTLVIPSRAAYWKPSLFLVGRGLVGDTVSISTSDRLFEKTMLLETVEVSFGSPWRAFLENHILSARRPRFQANEGRKRAAESSTQHSWEI